MEINMTKVLIVSLGCSKNLVDSEIMTGELIKNGFEITGDAESADVIVVNTCAFIDEAKSEAIDTILEMNTYRDRGHLKKLIVTGCMAERYKDEILRELPEVDAIVGVSRFDEIASVIKDEGDTFLGNENAAYPEQAKREISTPFYTAYLKIAEGCDNNCTYCAIPKIRGKFRSRKIEDIVSEAKKLAEDGVLELNVIAQDTAYYGTDLYGEPRLAQLLEKLCKIDGIEWIRVLYMYPERIDEKLLKVFVENKKLARYFDIPIQHINDEILKKMGRRTCRKEILEKIELIRKVLPDAVLRTSLIAGFPGETERQHEELCEFIKEVKFDRLGVFAYSREEGTPAYRLPNQIDEETKFLRRDRLMEIQNGISKELCKRFIGKILPVLAEEMIDGVMCGRSIYDAPEVDGNVYFEGGEENMLGEIRNVLIKDADDYDLTGVYAE